MKQKTGRKLLSFLLAIVMVVGLLPGMGMTAYAGTALPADGSEAGSGDVYFVGFTAGLESGDHVNSGEGMFDGNANNKACIGFTGSYSIEFSYSKPIIPTKYYFRTGDDTSSYTGRNPSAWKLEGKNSDETWTELDSKSGQTYSTDNNTATAFSISNTKGYKVFRLTITDINRSGNNSFPVSGKPTFQLSEVYMSGSLKPAATVTKAPTAKSLTYTGQAQGLVNAGEAENGTMQYALGTKDAATQPYTTSIPTATNAGTYYVWYKAVGDSSHSDSDAAYETVKISEKTEPGEETHSASGKVVDSDSKPVEDADIIVTPGGKTAKTNSKGEYTISGLSKGTYNIEASKGNKTKTIAVEISNSDVTAGEIKLPAGDENSSKVEREGSVEALTIENTVVKGMDELAASEDAEGAVYEMKITGETSAAEGGTQIHEKAQRRYANSSSFGESFLDISILKNGTKLNSYSTSSVIELIFPLDMTGKYNPLFWRYHGNTAQEFKQGNGSDGTFFVEGSGKNAEIHAFSSDYSTFALTYSYDDKPLVPNDPQEKAVTPTSVPSSGGSSSSEGNVISRWLPPYTSSSSDSKSSSSSSKSDKTYSSGSSKGYYTKTGKKTAEYTGPAIKHSSKIAVVPATVKMGKKTYKVTSIASFAFTGYDKLETVIIGENVVKISPDAFSGCEKLKVLKVKSKKLTKKKIKNCLRGSKIDTVIILKKAWSKFKYYKKIFTKKITGGSHKLTLKKSKQ